MKQRVIVKKGVEEMLRKEAVVQVQNDPKQFLSSIFEFQRSQQAFDL